MASSVGSGVLAMDRLGEGEKGGRVGEGVSSRRDSYKITATYQLASSHI